MKYALLPAVLGWVLAPGGTVQAAEEAREAMTDKSPQIIARWWGQACFTITGQDGRTVLVDPFPADFGYPPLTAAPGVVLITHEHRDHNSVDNVRGNPTVIRGAGRHEAGGLTFKGIAVSHDADQGSKRGPNTIFLWEMGGLRLAHVGDLGHVLTEAQVQEIGRVDVLMIPVGGYYTIDATQAVKVVKALHARLVLPMHVRTRAVPRLPIAPVDDFLKVLPEGWTVVRAASTEIPICADDLLAPDAGVKVIVPRYQ